ncbi:MAG: flagellin [Planctomycetota bacterium]|jgi:flagellin|nr:flagellin [Planctomycetota bacterium]
MGLIINHNLSALNTYRNLSSSSQSMAKSIEKLSSGYRINVGADGPSDLIISEQLRSQISGLERAVRNSSEAFNLIGIAEGALNEMNAILKQMRALSIHAANSGITSPEQVAADQAEMDSGIETLNRIANTTRYSDQYLLNGSKQLVYDVNTTVNEPTDHQLLDTVMTRVDEIFKRDGVKMTIGFTGDKTVYQANTETSAQRAYLEADSANSLCQLDGTRVTQAQEFILTGSGGSRLFSFAQGEHIGTIVDAINNVKDSTGIGATLIFASDVRVDRTVTGTVDGNGPDYAATPPTPATGYSGLNGTNSGIPGQYVYRSGDVQIYNAGLNNNIDAKISDFTLTPNAAAAFKVGFNCDGDGKIYAKVINKATNAIEYYKDKECTMLIAKGDDSFFAATNNSLIPSSPTQNLDGLFITLTDKAENLDVFEISLLGQTLDNMKDMQVNGIAGWADTANSVMSGVNLGINTSPEGSLYFKYTPITFDPQNSDIVRTFKVEAFNDSACEPGSLVASSGEVYNNIASSAGAGNTAIAISARYGQTVRLESVIMDNGKDSGLSITMNLPKPPYTDSMTSADMPTGEQVGDISFTNLGMRLYATEYGSAETIRIQNKSGELFYHYRESDTMEKIMIRSDTTVQIAGQDAQITMNGAPIFCKGLSADTTTPDFSGRLVFNQGELGLATLAVTGYDEGRLYSRATTLQGIEEDESMIAKNRRHFEPASLTYSMGAYNAGVQDRLGQPVDIYLDFSQLDATVEARISTLDTPVPITLTYTSGTDPISGESTGTLNIYATGLGTPPIPPVAVPITPDKLLDGFYITDPALKGLFIKSTMLIDLNNSANYVPASQNVTASNGDIMLEVNTYATNPRGNTTETMSNFLGGMQFQLGNTEGDQDRTVYSIPSMAMSELGRIEWNGVEYCLQNVLGGGIASLSRDPILAMRIVGQAIDDVSTLRARLGAFQANMLQTNINSLDVAIENITKTESAIRDTDMASESTQFTRFQVMQQAGTSMLAQANQTTQNVLSLLQ